MITILKLREHEELAEKAAQWFHQKWGVPLEAYIESIDECLCQKAAVPQWYLALEGHTVVGGLGVIENDFQLCGCNPTGRLHAVHCNENDLSNQQPHSWNYFYFMSCFCSYLHIIN